MTRSDRQCAVLFYEAIVVWLMMCLRRCGCISIEALIRRILIIRSVYTRNIIRSDRHCAVKSCKSTVGKSSVGLLKCVRLSIWSLIHCTRKRPRSSVYIRWEGGGLLKCVCIFIRSLSILSTSPAISENATAFEAMISMLTNPPPGSVEGYTQCNDLRAHRPHCGVPLSHRTFFSLQLLHGLSL